MTMPSSSNAGYWDDVSYSGANQWQATALDMILEYVPELVWPQAGDVLNRMRNDGQIAGSLKAYTLRIRRAQWALDPDGCRPSVYRQVAEDLGLPILGQKPRPSGARRRRVVWSDHLRVSLNLNAVFGHAPFEQAYDTDTGTGTARLATLVERMPKTISRIYVNEQDAQIDYVEQARYAGTPNAPRINRNALVWYVNDREGLGWRGRPLTRAAYPYWLIKDQMLRVLALSSRKWGTGIATAQALPGTSPQPVEMAEAARAVDAYQAGGTAVMPPGFRLALEGMTGSVPDTLSFVKYLDSQMSVQFLTQWINLGTTETGARALAEAFIDMFTESVQDFGDAHADQATAQIVVPLVNTNWGEDEPAPKIVCGNVSASHALNAQSIAALYTSGALSGDPELENAIREMFKLPLRDPNAPVQVQVPATTPPNPTEAP